MVGISSLTTKEVAGARGSENMRLMKKGSIAAAAENESFIFSL